MYLNELTEKNILSFPNLRGKAGRRIKGCGQRVFMNKLQSCL